MNIISIKRKKFNSMDKSNLLDHMMSFQEKRSKLGYLNQEMIFEGIELFTELSKQAETPELYYLCESYIKHLKTESKKLG